MIYIFLSTECSNNKCDVFLGGSCNPTTWRADTAIPELKKHGISYYNPVSSKINIFYSGSFEKANLS